MSQAALLEAVRDRLIKQLKYVLHKDIDILPSGKPAPIAGQRFVSVWGRKRSTKEHRALDERYEVKITVSLRGGNVPWDRWGDGIWLKALRGMESSVREIVAVIHGSGDDGISLLAAANDLIGPTSNKFLTGVPLIFSGEQGPDPRGASWWGKPDENWAGIVSTLTWGEAQRIQLVDNAI